MEGWRGRKHSRRYKNVQDWEAGSSWCVRIEAVTLWEIRLKDSSLFVKLVILIVDQELKECVLDEFSELIESSVNSNLGGLNFAQKTLSWLMEILKLTIWWSYCSGSDSLELWMTLKRWTQGKFITLRFRPQTITFVLANVDADKGSEVLQLILTKYSGAGCGKSWCHGDNPNGSIEVLAIPSEPESAKEAISTVKTGGVVCGGFAELVR